MWPRRPVEKFTPTHTTNMLEVPGPHDRPRKDVNERDQDEMTDRINDALPVRRVLLDPVVSCVSARPTLTVFLDSGACDARCYKSNS